MTGTNIPCYRYTTLWTLGVIKRSGQTFSRYRLRWYSFLRCLWWGAGGWTQSLHTPWKSLLCPWRWYNCVSGRSVGRLLRRSDFCSVVGWRRLHLLSQSEKPRSHLLTGRLFDRVRRQSGGSFGPWMTTSGDSSFVCMHCGIWRHLCKSRWWRPVWAVAVVHRRKRRGLLSLSFRRIANFSSLLPRCPQVS